MQIDDQIHIDGNRVLVVGFWGHQNMGDELILLGTIRLLLAKKKEIFVVSVDNEWLKSFFSQFIDISSLSFIDELPRGFKSLWNYIINGEFTQLKYFFKVDTVILGGWEILTEESPHSYYYWFWSIWPAFLWKRKLYIMWGVQIPKHSINKFLFKIILWATTKIFPRDLEELENLKAYGLQNVEFFMDTSYFSIHDRKKYKKESKKEYIVVNINRNGRLFMGEFIEDIKQYLHMGYTVYFVPVCAWATDDDTRYFDTIKELVKNKLFQLYDRRKDFKAFLKFLWWSRKVISARLHLFLISEFMGLETKAYPYQKKVGKMQETLRQLKF